MCFALASVVLGKVGCRSPAKEAAPHHPTARPDVPSQVTDEARTPLELLDEIEHLVDERSADDRRRLAAYENVAGREDDGSAEYALARAGLAGRVAETRGLKALRLVREAEYFARLSVERDPNLRTGEARRMLGSLRALAGEHLEGTTSEDGVELLEALVEEDPSNVQNQLRLAQAFIALGDPESGLESLCAAHTGKARLRPSEILLIEELMNDTLEELGTGTLPCSD